MSAVAIVSASIAGGHDAAAGELARRLDARGLSTEVLDLVELLPAGIGRLARALYRVQLTAVPRTWSVVHDYFDRPQAPPPEPLVGRLAQHGIARALAPDTRVAVSTYPIAGRALGALRRSGGLTVPALAYLTDMSVHGLWLAAGVDAHLAIHPEPARQATELGASRVEVVAPAVGPAFGTVPRSSRGCVRRRYGLPPDARLALVAGGSWGVGDLAATMADIAGSGAAVPVALCGRNERAAERLRRQGYPHVLGWTDEPAELIAACDVVVQNSGGVTSMEAIASGVPVLSYRWMPGHGRTNSEALDRAGLAPLVGSRAELATALAAARPPTSPPDVFQAPDPADVIEKFAARPAERAS